MTSMTPFLRSPHWLPVAAHIIFKTLMLAYTTQISPTLKHLSHCTTRHLILHHYSPGPTQCTGRHTSVLLSLLAPRWWNNLTENKWLKVCQTFDCYCIMLEYGWYPSGNNASYWHVDPTSCLRSPQWEAARSISWDLCIRSCLQFKQCTRKVQTCRTLFKYCRLVWRAWGHFSLISLVS